jgi:putative ATP-dependent endonuclease of the OLD family
MRLSRFTIANHAVLEDMDVEVRDHLCIVGANDVGKSTVLRLLNLLLGATVQQLYAALTPGDLRDGDEALVVSADLTDLSQEEAGSFPYEVHFEGDEPARLSIELEIRVSEEDDKEVVIDRFFPDAGTRRSPSRDQLEVIGWRYLPATRSTAAHFMEGKNSPLRAMLNAVDLGTGSTALVSLMDTFHDDLEANPALTQLREEIAQHLSRSLPRTMDKDALALRTAVDPAEDPLQDVTLFLREDEMLKSLDQQSDGLRQLMALTFFDLAQQQANVVAVDEPEMHLHASSQRTVAGLLADSQQQRLVVTHSPYVIQKFEPKHVLVISHDRRAKQIAAQDFTAVDKERVAWWTPQLLEALTARRVLIVEGLADRIVVEAAAAAKGISLDREGVTVFALDGADKFKHVTKILGSTWFDIDLCGLCDEDRETSWAGVLKTSPKKLAKQGFFVARKDLEHEYAAALGASTLAALLLNEGVAKEQGLCQAADVGAIGDLTEEHLADFIMSKDSRKTPAARAVATILSSNHVDASDSLSGLLGFVAGAGS